MSLLKITVPGLTFDEFHESQARYGGQWDGVLLKEGCLGNQLSNNIIEIEKIDFHFFLPNALVTPEGKLHDVEMIKTGLEGVVNIMFRLENTNSAGEFVLPNETEPRSWEELKKEHDLKLRHLWKEQCITVTSKYPGQLVVCCDIYGNS